MARGKKDMAKNGVLISQKKGYLIRRKTGKRNRTVIY
jgi:hypothetical protein